MLKYFSIKDMAIIVFGTILVHIIVMGLFYGLIGLGAVVSSVLSTVGTVFALYNLRSIMDATLEVKPKRKPL